MFYIAKVKKEATIAKKLEENAGIDLYSCFESDKVVINPGEIEIIPTGIAICFPSDYVFFVKERSSTGILGLATRMGVVDSGYRGEIKVGINNVTNRIIEITKSVDIIEKSDLVVKYPYNKAIAQGVFLKINTDKCREVSYEDLLSFESQRMDKMFGSTGS